MGYAAGCTVRKVRTLVRNRHLSTFSFLHVDESLIFGLVSGMLVAEREGSGNREPELRNREPAVIIPERVLLMLDPRWRYGVPPVP
jgi:hypothetical protein